MQRAMTRYFIVARINFRSAPMRPTQVGQVCTELVALASGAQGQVHRARLIATGEAVAVKCMSKLASPHWPREVRALHALQAVPGVVRLVEWGHDEDDVFLVTELCRGTDLLDAVGDGIPEPRALRIGARMLEILAGVHALGFVHLDVKPENWMVDGDDDVTLIDLGSTERLSLVDASGQPTGQAGQDSQAGRLESHGPCIPPGWPVPPLQKTDRSVGTWSYLPPELARGRFCDRTDVWAAGATLFCAIHNHMPYALRPHPVYRPVYRDIPSTLAESTRLSPGARSALGAMMSDVASRPTAIEALASLTALRS
jgi:serine/threonine protein kinase